MRLEPSEVVGDTLRANLVMSASCSDSTSDRERRLVAGLAIVWQGWAGLTAMEVPVHAVTRDGRAKDTGMEVEAGNV